jgi:uncharacterized protein (UPF0297 family)
MSEDTSEFTPLDVLKEKLGTPQSENEETDEKKKNKETLKSVSDSIAENGKEIIAIVVAFLLAVNPWTIKFIINKVGNVTSESGNVGETITTFNMKGLAFQTLIFGVFLALIKVAVSIDII